MWGALMAAGVVLGALTLAVVAPAVAQNVAAVRRGGSAGEWALCHLRSRVGAAVVDKPYWRGGAEYHAYHERLRDASDLLTAVDVSTGRVHVTAFFLRVSHRTSWGCSTSLRPTRVSAWRRSSGSSRPGLRFPVSSRATATARKGQRATDMSHTDRPPEPGAN